MPTSTAEEKDKAAEAVAPKLKELEAAVQEATALIEGTKNDKRGEHGKRSCSDSCLTGKANGLVAMITGTVSGLVGCLGVCEFLLPIQHLEISAVTDGTQRVLRC